MKNGPLRDRPGRALEQGDGGRIAVHRRAVEQAIDVGVRGVELLRPALRPWSRPRVDGHGGTDRGSEGAGEVKQHQWRGEPKSAEHRIPGVAIDQARGLKYFGQAGRDGFRARRQVHDAPVLYLRPPLSIPQLVIEAAGGRTEKAKAVPGCRKLTAGKAQPGHGAAFRKMKQHRRNPPQGFHTRRFGELGH